MTRDEWKPPSLWECWKDVHSAKDVWEFLPLLVPMPIIRAWGWIRHPRNRYYVWSSERWARKIVPGDIVCDCRGQHLRVTSVDDDEWPVVNLEDGTCTDLIACASPVEADNSCHSYYMPEEA